MNDKNLMETLDVSKIKTKRELAMYILGICNQNDMSDGICLDYILNACYTIVGTKQEVIQ